MRLNPGRILYQDQHLLAVQKLSGELVVKGAGRVDRLPLLDFLKKEYPGLRPVNRLDFETSGIVLFARTKQAFDRLTEQYKKHEPRKIYHTIVSGHPPRRIGVIRAPLPARSDKTESVPAETRYRVLEEFPFVSFMEVELVTGRKHQIRRHFASIGRPLALDWLYGDEKFNKAFQKRYKLQKFFLHAARLELKHPITSEPLTIDCPLPDAFQKLLMKLRMEN